MTTIAANLEMMVADSKCTLENAGISYPATKIVRAKDCIVGACGDNGDCSRFLEWAQGGWKQKPKFTHNVDDEDDAIIGLVLKRDGIYIFCPSYPAPEKIDAEFFAIGSGGTAARAAMLLGADPVKAVEISCQVDEYSGLPLQILKLKE